MTENKKFEIEWVNPETITPYAKNAKLHSVEQIDKIAGQIAAFGFDQPIVVDRQRVIIKGHGRRAAALRLGLKEVPIIVSTLDEYAAIASRIGDNKVAEAPWDNDLLRFEIGTLKAHDVDLNLTALDELTINNITDPLDADKAFGSSDNLAVSERSVEDYENTDIRQMILIMDPETFETIMTRFAALQVELGVETNLEIVQHLLEAYDSSRSSS